MSSDEPGPGRYFFAVWPDAAVQAQLLDWSRAVRVDASARRVPGANLHVTLAFLANLDDAQVAAVRKAGADTRWSGAVLALDRIGYWKRSRIVWAGSRAGSAGLAALVDDLRGRLRCAGFCVEERPFVPHVTLYRRAQRKPRWEHRVVQWRMDDFCLVESRLSSAGAQYAVLDRWSANDDMK